MERANISDKIYKFEKTGGGTFVLSVLGRRRHIKPNQVFQARLSEIPKAFWDTIRLADGRRIEELQEEEMIQEEEKFAANVPQLEYEIKTRTGGWFDVVGKDGKPVNEKGLREGAAKELLASLKG